MKELYAYKHAQLLQVHILKLRWIRIIVALVLVTCKGKSTHHLSSEAHPKWYPDDALRPEAIVSQSEKLVLEGKHAQAIELLMKSLKRSEFHFMVDDSSIQDRMWSPGEYHPEQMVPFTQWPIINLRALAHQHKIDYHGSPKSIIRRLQDAKIRPLSLAQLQALAVTELHNGRKLLGYSLKMDLNAYANILRKEGKYQKSALHYEQLLSMEPDNDAVLAHWAHAISKTGLNKQHVADAWLLVANRTNDLRLTCAACSNLFSSNVQHLVDDNILKYICERAGESNVQQIVGDLSSAKEQDNLNCATQPFFVLGKHFLSEGPSQNLDYAWYFLKRSFQILLDFPTIMDYDNVVYDNLLDNGLSEKLNHTRLCIYRHKLALGYSRNDFRNEADALNELNINECPNFLGPPYLLGAELIVSNRDSEQGLQAMRLANTKIIAHADIILEHCESKREHVENWHTSSLYHSSWFITIDSVIVSPKVNAMPRKLMNNSTAQEVWNWVSRRPYFTRSPLLLVEKHWRYVDGSLLFSLAQLPHELKTLFGAPPGDSQGLDRVLNQLISDIRIESLDRHRYTTNDWIFEHSIAMVELKDIFMESKCGRLVKHEPQCILFLGPHRFQTGLDPKFTFVSIENSTVTHVDCPTINLVQNTWFSYFHWHAEVLPRLLLTQKHLYSTLMRKSQSELQKYSCTKIKYLVPRRAMLEESYQWKSLKYLGFDKDDFILYNYGPTTRFWFRHLYMLDWEPRGPTLHRNDLWTMWHAPKEGLRMVSSGIKAGSQKDRSGHFSYPPIVFISRTDAKRRQLPGEERIIAALQALYGVNNVCKFVGKGMSFADQIDIFKHARIAMGPHGAGFTNILWMEEGSSVLEFAVNPLGGFYTHMGLSLGLDYWNIEEITSTYLGNYPAVNESQVNVIVSAVAYIIRERALLFAPASSHPHPLCKTTPAQPLADFTKVKQPEPQNVKSEESSSNDRTGTKAEPQNDESAACEVPSLNDNTRAKVEIEIETVTWETFKPWIKKEMSGDIRHFSLLFPDAATGFGAFTSTSTVETFSADVAELPVRFGLGNGEKLRSHFRVGTMQTLVMLEMRGGKIKVKQPRAVLSQSDVVSVLQDWLHS